MLRVALMILMVFLSFEQVWAMCLPWSKGEIKVTVIREGDRVPMPGILINLEGSNQECTTNDFGICRFKEVEAGNVSLSILRRGAAPMDRQVNVQRCEVSNLQVVLAPGLIYDRPLWCKKVSEDIKSRLEKGGFDKARIAVAFYQRAKQDNEQGQALPNLTLEFATTFNSLSTNPEMQVVIRDKQQASNVLNELNRQHQFKADFDPVTVAKLGKMLGADVMIVGALEEYRDYIQPQISAVSVAKSAYLPGVSLNDILLRRENLR